MKTLVVFLAALAFGAPAMAQTVPVQFPRLSRMLDSLADADQRPMQELMRSKLPDSTSKRLIAEQHVIFARHQPVLEAILKKYGYPGFKQVGEKSAGNFFLLVQHADAHPEFQRQVLQRMRKEVKAKNASPRSYAYLTDRVAEATNQPQEYGTQVIYTGPGIGKAAPRSLRDPKNVNKRRAALGMETLEEYLRKNDQIHEQMNTPKPAGL
ncbi:hypothetical protein SAMN02745146_1363 [Hymenobacter daecheongensis DSM 21074]|uniref:DUF4296 domain-containing protein n=1 Tax=Hymenobacter daecheongensis DSM 21074 TaxID=1121955 RepID=A0A1M6D3B7_9BACT|nr:DUF6624 domain-containing protein [Hymenobacter daecheongensis]SHI67772.1 hypothetical protein SAMN02745146_1363 [Hymenobacter daecheongensis DSM 21074]